MEGGGVIEDYCNTTGYIYVVRSHLEVSKIYGEKPKTVE